MSTDESELRDRKNRQGGLITIFVIVVLCLWAWSCERRAVQRSSSFDQVSRGMTEAQVISLLGAPNWNGKCGSERYNFVQATIGAESCLVYASPFAPLVPEYPVVYLDARRRVIDKYDYQSP